MTAIDLRLDRVSQLSSLFPTYTRPTCHIAGTNGKGSVCAILSSIFLAASPPLSVGRFNSPHLVDVLDSITINGTPVESKIYSAAREDVEKLNGGHQIGASSFELLTMTALVIFERAAVDIVILEVGMGGRLDATNIIPDESVLISALTAVDLDHQKFLGDDPVSIAKEKAAIARPGKPFVIGAQTFPEVTAFVKEFVGKAGGKVVEAATVIRREWVESCDGSKPRNFSFYPKEYSPLRPQPVAFSIPCYAGPVYSLLPLYGEHQLKNLGLAVSLISEILSAESCISTIDLRKRITPHSLIEGIKATSWAGRLSFHLVDLPSASDSESENNQLIVLADGAHNPASAKTVARFLEDLFSQAGASETVLSDRGVEDSGRIPEKKLSLTFVVGLSCSPPKTPRSVLVELLPSRLPSWVEIRLAAVRFTSPEGMPWINSVPPSMIRQITRELSPEVEILDWPDDTAISDGQLVEALSWVSRSQSDAGGLVVVAGSLYLVADFYRFCNSAKS